MTNKKFIKPVLIISIITLLIVGIVATKNFAKAEQSGSSPESGVTSYIKSLYSTLQGLNYGFDEDDPSWGTYWNRIKTAAKWYPNGTVTVTGVKSGITFYDDSRTVQTGTYPNPTSCSYLSGYNLWHDSLPVAENVSCDVNPWTTNPSSLEGDDDLAGRGGLDPRTGLTWSKLLLNSAGTVTFSHASNSTWNWDGTLKFTVTAATAAVGDTYTNNGQTFTVAYAIANATTLYAKPASSGLPAASGDLTKVTGAGTNPIQFSAYTLYGSNVAVGSKTAKELCANMNGGGVWRLPTQKELMQAYIDGSFFNLTQPSYSFWSATEYSGTSAWYVNLYSGVTTSNSKSTNSYQVRCVR